MPKSGFYKIVFLWFSVIFLTGNLSYAQTQFLEFKFGSALSSPINASAEGKHITDFQRGLTISAGFGHELPNELLRFYGEVSYCGKGEKYPLKTSGGEYSSFMNYFEVNINARMYFAELLYCGAGVYSGYCFNCEVLSGETISGYKKFDFGPRAAVGTEIGFMHIRGNIELAYEYGLLNFADISGIKIQNQALLLTVGIQVKILKKYYRHY